jgi:hypothetical protein
LVQNFKGHRRRDACRAVVNEFCDFGHKGTLKKQMPPSK